MRSQAHHYPCAHHHRIAFHVASTQVTGANIAAVEAAVQKHHVAAAPQTFTGSGFSLGAGESPNKPSLLHLIPT